MKHCKEFEELISAYVDDELDSSHKLFMEEHLRSCPDCLNLLAFYHGVSVSMTDSCAEAPPSIRKNVMAVLKGPSAKGIVTPSYHDEIDEDVIARTKKRKRMRTILTRYAPIAACLAIALLVLPQFFNIDRSYNQAVPPAPTAMPEMAYDEIAAAVTFGDGEDLEIALEVDFAAADTPRAMTEEAAGGAALPIEPAEGDSGQALPPSSDTDVESDPRSGWSMYDSLLEPEYVASAGYYAFIMIEHEFSDTFSLIAYFRDYYLLEQIDVARFIEQYEAYIVYFIPGDNTAEFALIQFVV